MTFIITMAAAIIFLTLTIKNKKLQHTAYKEAIQNTDLHNTIKSMISSNKKDVHIVKYVRNQTGLGLVNAKNLVDEIKYAK